MGGRHWPTDRGLCVAETRIRRPNDLPAGIFWVSVLFLSVADSEKYLFGAAPGAGVRVYRESVVAQRLLLLILTENQSFLVKNCPGARDPGSGIPKSIDFQLKSIDF